MPANILHDFIKARLPERLKGAFAIVWQGQAKRHPGPAEEFALWVEANPQYGFRVPNAAERARATGQAAYLAALGLTGQRRTCCRPEELFRLVALS